MRVVVTGGMGFIGTSVVRRLLAMNHEVILVDYVESRLREYERCGLPILKEVYHNLKDVEDAIEPEELLKRISTGLLPVRNFIHLGACVNTIGVPPNLFEENITYVRALVDVLPRDSKVVFASSAAVYGNEGVPCNAYGMSKQLGENILEATAGTVTNLRFFNVFGRYEHHKGPMASVPFKIAQAYRKGGRFEMFHPNASRDFVSVDQVTDCVIGHMLSQGVTSRIMTYDVGSGWATTFEGLDHALMRAFGRTVSSCDIVEAPSGLNGKYQFHTRAGDRAPLSPFVTHKLPSGDQMLVEYLKEQFCEKD